MQKNRFDFSWGERHSIISTESWLRGYVLLRDVIGNDNKNVFVYVKGGQVNTYNAASDLQPAIASGQAILDHNFLESHLKQTTEIREEFHRLHDGVKETKLSAISDSELLNLFEKYQDLFDRTWAYFKVSQPEYLELAKEKLEQLIKEKDGSNDVARLFITLTTPTELDLIKEEELAALRRSLQPVSDAELWQHADEYPWLFFNTYDRAVIHTFLKEKFSDLQAMPKDERNVLVEKIREEMEEHKTGHDELLAKLGNDADIKYLASVFGRLAIDRLKMKAWWGGGEYLFLPLFEEIAQRAGVTVDDLFMGYKTDDIIALLRDGMKLSGDIITARKQLYAVVLEEGTMRFHEEADAIRKFNELVGSGESAGDSAGDIKGVIANTGKARGKARIIVVEDLKRLLADMERFEEGDIMVTTMTQPTMVSLARQAAAIVTNEGGITSHASILAREYGIPCIVGTRTATFAIKDGDEVEVDVDNGVVRVVRRA